MSTSKKDDRNNRSRRPKILVFDIETAPALAYVWGFWNQNINKQWVMDHMRVICFAYKWHGEKGQTKFYSEYHHGYVKMLTKLRDLLDEADVVVHYNGKKFDEKRSNADFKKEGLTLPSSYFSVDMLTNVKAKFDFGRHDLDTVGRILVGDHKVSHSGPETWLKCLLGDKKAWDEMKKYNIQDVDLLDEVYIDALASGYLTTHPNMDLFEESYEPTCENCTGKNFKKDGFHITKNTKYQKYVCKGCGKSHRGRKNLYKAELVGIR